MSDTIYEFKATDIKGIEHALEEYRGKVVLIVNTASKCGFTPQFKGLEKLYEQYKDQGLAILGFPCNQFANQDPADDAQISEFCEMNYGVSFPMFGKIDVNGDNAHPLFEHLKTEAPGLAGSKKVKWNFTKFLVGRDGKVIKRYAPATSPESIEKDIARLL